MKLKTAASPFTQTCAVLVVSSHCVMLDVFQMLTQEDCFQFSSVQHVASVPADLYHHSLFHGSQCSSHTCEVETEILQ